MKCENGMHYMNFNMCNVHQNPSNGGVRVTIARRHFIHSTVGIASCEFLNRREHSRSDCVDKKRKSSSLSCRFFASPSLVVLTAKQRVKCCSWLTATCYYYYWCRISHCLTLVPQLHFWADAGIQMHTFFLKRLYLYEIRRDDSCGSVLVITREKSAY